MCRPILALDGLISAFVLGFLRLCQLFIWFRYWLKNDVSPFLVSCVVSFVRSAAPLLSTVDAFPLLTTICFVSSELKPLDLSHIRSSCAKVVLSS